MGKLLHNMDIQLCCFLAGIYVCVHLFGCQNKSTCFHKFKSSNVFYARARQMMWQMMPVATEIKYVNNIGNTLQSRGRKFSNCEDIQSHGTEQCGCVHVKVTHPQVVQV